MAYITNESFTTGSAPSGWSGSANFGYTTSPAPLEGSYSVLIDSGNGAAYSHGSEITGEQWGRFQFHPLALPGSFEKFFAVYEGTFSTIVFEIYLNSTGTLTLSGSGAFEGTVGTMAADTTYYVFWRYQPSTGGNNGELELWFNTSDDRAGAHANNHAVYTSGNQTGGMRYPNWFTTGTGIESWILDTVAWADTDEFAGGAANRRRRLLLGA
jgi:hypothetical protein